MSSQTVPPPFDPPAQAGCGKPLLLMAGAVGVLVLAALVVFAFKAGPLLALTFRTVSPVLVERLSDEVSEAQKERLINAFEAAAQRAEEGKLDTEKLLPVQQQFASLASGAAITPQQAAALSRDLEVLAGVEPPADAIPELGVEPAEPATPPPPPGEGPGDETPVPPSSEEADLPVAVMVTVRGGQLACR